MSITQSILAIIEQRPGLTAEIIQEELGIRNATCKAALWRLWRDNRISRFKTHLAASKGPQSVYAYYIGEGHGIQKETREEVNAEQESSSGQTNGSGSAGSQVRAEGGYPPIYR